LLSVGRFPYNPLYLSLKRRDCLRGNILIGGIQLEGKSYNKLVRDKIPYIISASGKTYLIETVTDDEVMKWLYDKLIEETNELIQDKNLEEIADVVEVVLTIASKYGYTLEDVFEEVDRKRKEKGGFEKNIILKKVYDK
jgi:predicted house-cleaning noncanonical NTP pyrophosphatase (MazG superfamily)